MRGLAIRAAVAILLSSTAVALSGEAASQQSPSRPLVTEAQHEAWQTELSNWGRWGSDDQPGTLNLITPARRRAAMALVKRGVPVSLAANAFTEKATDVPCPAEWGMTSASDTGATGSGGVSLHSPAPPRLTSILSHTHSSAERCGTATTRPGW